MARKPVSIKAARKKKQTQAVRVCYPLPEGDDWKPSGWGRAWDLVFEKLYPVVLARIVEEEKQQHAA